jgi:hypothetical protein
MSAALPPRAAPLSKTALATGTGATAATGPITGGARVAAWAGIADSPILIKIVIAVILRANRAHRAPIA